jgi:hypothetical protein
MSIDSTSIFPSLSHFICMCHNWLWMSQQKRHSLLYNELTSSLLDMTK